MKRSARRNAAINRTRARWPGRRFVPQYATAVVAIAMLSASACTWAQVDPVDHYLTSAENSANSVVSNGGAQARGTAMEAGQALLNAITAFRAAYPEMLKLTESA